MPLPIWEVEDELCSALRESNRVILEAPTGSGKSTQVPQVLHNHHLLGDGEAVILQPRRIAARMLAKRVSEEMNTGLGGLVGYQVRHESKISRATRIRFITEGLLLRRMITDGGLKGVNCVVFDEFHERSANADLSLSRVIQLQQESRPDLKVIVMSATLETGALEQYLEPCRIVKSEGRTYPVDVSYVSARTVNAGAPIWELAADQTVSALEAEPEGHALVFMPGAYEIGQTIRALGQQLSSSRFELLPLYSDLSVADQDRVFAKGGRRKVIVSTNVAETSLTIDGVRIVVDSGQARIARYDPERGINTLWIEKISDASARQRTGRAGRIAPGRCVRLWTEKSHGDRAPFDEAEIARVDLAEIFLSLLATGIENLETFPWFEAPDESRMREAITLLESLGAIDEKGKLTKRGFRMSEFPLHPRYASMMLTAERMDCVSEAALAAAIAQSRSLFIRKAEKKDQSRRMDLVGDGSRGDVIASVRGWIAARDRRFDIGFCRDHGIHAQAARQIEKIAYQLVRYEMNPSLFENGEAVNEEGLRKCLLVGFPDRVAKRLDRGTLRCQLVGERRGDLTRESFAQSESIMVACEVSEISHQRGDTTTVLGLCSGIELEWLKELFGASFSNGEEVVFDERQKRVVSRRFARYRDLDIESIESLDPDESTAASVLAELVLSGKAKLDKWDASIDSLIIRANLISSLYPEYGIDSIDDEAIEMIVEQACLGAKSLRHLKKKEVMPSVKEWIGSETLALIDSFLPERLLMENGRLARVRYSDTQSPILSAKIQDFYDLPEPPVLCEGKLKPMYELLAPNSRPIQKTEDLNAFWDNSYESIKKELKGRYPKHEWR